jgi:predicted ATPase/DNA-binding winged helix-turn-helix (wHTH) protein
MTAHFSRPLSAAPHGAPDGLTAGGLVGGLAIDALLRPHGALDRPFDLGGGPGADRESADLVFGRYTLLTHSRELLVDGVPAPLGARCLEVLMVLMEASGELVTKDQILDRVWPARTVEENCLQFHISTLRKALGEDRDFIRTVSGRGYRFTPEITPRARQSSAARRALSVDRSDSFIRLESGNIPRATSELIGRESAARDVKALVAANRLVTLVGAGGVGKTCLALEVARQLAQDFDGGVWIADLGAVSGAPGVLCAIAAALGLLGSTKSFDDLARELRAGRRLLVLDTCEHLVEAAAELAEALLRVCPDLRIIATSQQPLRAEAEWLYRAAPLDVPPATTIAPVDPECAALKLFLVRASAAHPELRFDPPTLAAAIQVCRRLDGFPLAIELAAANVAALGIEGLAERLDDGLALLIHGRRTAAIRHRSLRAAMDWSYRLLSDVERAMLRRLSVLEGAFTIGEAQAAAADDDEIGPNVIPAMTGLVSKSLLLRQDVADARFRLPEFLRRYILDHQDR